MSKERSAAITIGGKEYELVLTTRATKGDRRTLRRFGEPGRQADEVREL